MRPSPEQSKKWLDEAIKKYPNSTIALITQHVAKCAYIAGSNEELNQCGKLMERHRLTLDSTTLRELRRPGLTKKQLGLDAIAIMKHDHIDRVEKELCLKAIQEAIDDLPDT